MSVLMKKTNLKTGSLFSQPQIRGFSCAGDDVVTKMHHNDEC